MTRCACDNVDCAMSDGRRACRTHGVGWTRCFNEAVRSFIVGRTVAAPVAGGTVDVDVEQEIPMCQPCYDYHTEKGAYHGARPDAPNEIS